MSFPCIKAGKLQFAINLDGNRVSWSAENLPMQSPVNGDFWRVHMDDDYYRSMTVRSSNQKGSVSQKENELIIHYDKLVDDSGRIFDTEFTVHVCVNSNTYESLEFWAEVNNHSDARMNELQLPFVELSTICAEDHESDIFFKMNGLGERIENPWKALESNHTEYMAADYNEIWDAVQYPCAASMCWFGVQSNNHFLYVGKHDEQLRTATLAAAINPRHSEPKFILAISHYVMAVENEQLESAHSIVSLNEGDWRTGSDIYGNWARNSWYSVPEKPDWVKNMTGWQRIIMRHQYGEVFFTYADLPRVYTEGKEYGLDTLMVFGWWKGRFDNGYPCYEADPALGGEDGLKNAIDEVHKLGGRIILYTNGILIDVSTDYYKETGYRICHKDLDGNEYRDHYKFINDGMLLRSFGYKSFVTACQSTPEWQERLLTNGRLKLSFGPDSIFFDQLGGHTPLLCFDESHPHGHHGDIETLDRIKNMDAIKSLCETDQAFGTEFTVDCFVPHVDYHHGCQLGNIFKETAYPALFQRTFPEAIMTNRFLHDDRDGFERLLNHAFIYGHRFDVSIYRGRKFGIAGIPIFGEKVKELIALRAQYKEFFYTGRFVCDHTPVLPNGIKMTEYKSNDGRYLCVMWNDSDAVATCSIGSSKCTLQPQQVICVPWNN